MIYTVNGIERDPPCESGSSLRQFVDAVRASFGTDNALVSSIRVNGEELAPAVEDKLSTLDASQLEKIEVTTSHPREVAEDTLQSLIEFSPHLASLSRACADLVTSPEYFVPRFEGLTDGIETFTEALRSAKQILRLAGFQPIAVLEADMLSIVKDILACRETGDRAYLAALLAEHLPANLELWRAEGIPAMIRARDS